MDPIKLGGSMPIRAESLPKNEKAAEAQQSEVAMRSASDSVEISRYSELKSKEEAVTGIEKEVAAQNKMAQQSALQIEGLSFLGAGVNLSLQSGMVDSVMNRLNF
jgi:hypothetical protein